MKNILVIIILLGIFNEGYTQLCSSKGSEITNCRLQYVDSITNKGYTKLRVLDYIGDNDYWSKPNELFLSFDFPKKEKGGIVQISIEELIAPLKQFELVEYALKDTTWVLHKVYYSEPVANLSFKGNEYLIKYNTAGYYASELYLKFGFRIVLTYLFIEDGLDKCQLYFLEYYYPN